MLRSIALCSLLLTATLAMVPAEAPDTFNVKFETSVGDFVMEVHREWAPLGAARVKALVVEKYYDGDRFFRVMKGFMVQFGINGDPAVNKRWLGQMIRDDSVRGSNTRGIVTFAKSGRNSRGTQMFINYADNSRLDRDGFSPVGKIIEGMDVVDKIFANYGEEPDQEKIQMGGNSYLEGKYPRLDYIKHATIVP